MAEVDKTSSKIDARQVSTLSSRRSRTLEAAE